MSTRTYVTDLSGRRLYFIEPPNRGDTSNRRYVCTVDGKRLGSMADGNSYDATGRLLARSESETFILSAAGIRLPV